jgi:hypothetical protein
MMRGTRKAHKFVTTATAEKNITANSCCWQSKPTSNVIRSTNMQNILARK